MYLCRLLLTICILRPEYHMDGLKKMHFQSMFGCIISIYSSNPVISYRWFYLQDYTISFNGAATSKDTAIGALPKRYQSLLGYLYCRGWF